MLSVQGLVDRYQDGLGPSLSWGGKLYYKVNDPQPYFLNSDCMGFRLNDQGRVQCYTTEEDPNPPKSALLIGGKVETRWGSVRWWDERLSEFYPHEWYPEKPIRFFQCIRNCPGFTKDIDYRVIQVLPNNKPGDTKYTYVFDDDQRVWKEPFMLRYPEFFRPIY